jgi:hypothetical protein
MFDIKNLDEIKRIARNEQPEGGKTLLQAFKEERIDKIPWERFFEILKQANKEAVGNSNKIFDIDLITIDIDLRAIFAVLDKYVTARLHSDKVLEGILQDISHNTDRIASAKE